MIFEQRDLAEEELNRVEPQGTPAVMRGANSSTKEFPLVSGLVHDIGAYWKTTGGWFSIPKLSHDHASIV